MRDYFDWENCARMNKEMEQWEMVEGGPVHEGAVGGVLRGEVLVDEPVAVETTDEAAVRVAGGEGAVVLVVGSEGNGLSRLVTETCDQLLSIPMVSDLESLNAGVAASVALYAIAQRRAAGE